MATLLGQPGHLNEARLHNHKDICERIHKDTAFLAHVGGKAADATNQTVLHQVPNAVADLRVPLQEEERASGTPGHWKDHLDSIIKASSKCAGVHISFQEDDRRAKISEALLPGLDQVLDYINVIDADAAALIQGKLGIMAFADMEKDLVLKTKDLGRLSRGHPHIAEAHLHKDIKIGDLKKNQLLH